MSENEIIVAQDTGEIIYATDGMSLLPMPICDAETFSDRCVTYEQKALSIMRAGQDYMEIPGTKGKSLLSGGADKLARFFGLTINYQVLEQEVNHDIQTTYDASKWEDAKQPSDDEVERKKAAGMARFTKRDGRWQYQEKITDTGTAIGRYRYVIGATVINQRTGQKIAHALGICSTTESKYARNPRDSEHTVASMAAKRAKVKALKDALGLSALFDDPETEVPRPRGGGSAEGGMNPAPSTNGRKILGWGALQRELELSSEYAKNCVKWANECGSSIARWASEFQMEADVPGLLMADAWSDFVDKRREAPGTDSAEQAGGTDE